MFRQEASPANTSTMSPEHDDPDDDDKLTGFPLNMTGGFSQSDSPFVSHEMGNIDAVDDSSAALTGSFCGD